MIRAVILFLWAIGWAAVANATVAAQSFASLTQASLPICVPAVTGKGAIPFEKLERLDATQQDRLAAAIGMEHLAEDYAFQAGSSAFVWVIEDLELPVCNIIAFEPRSRVAFPDLWVQSLSRSGLEFRASVEAAQSGEAASQRPATGGFANALFGDGFSQVTDTYFGVADKALHIFVAVLLPVQSAAFCELWPELCER